MAYNSKNVQVIINDRFMTGFRDGDIYSYEESDDRFTMYEGSDGTVDFSERPTNGAQITIGFKHNSPSLSFLEGLYNNRTLISITIKDSNEDGIQTISGNNGVIMRRPNSSRGKEISERELVVMLPDHKVTEG